MSDSFDQFLQACQRRSRDSLPRLLGTPASEYGATDDKLAPLLEASNYSLSNGGKRVRPVLVYAAAEAVAPGADPTALDHAAAAMEMIHTYSLVHDDLPAMDDDDLRRGRPSCHRAYDEATAILVGDGLQARAFELLATAPGLKPAVRLRMVQVLAAAAGPRGMVGGQALDVAATNAEISLAQLRAMHALKTGALIRAALALGALAAGANATQLAALDDYGRDIGLAFQVVDDILDVEGDTSTLGKTGGKDSDANKPTYVALLGLQGAREEAASLLQSALESLLEFPSGADHLRGLAHYIVQRQN